MKTYRKSRNSMLMFLFRMRATAFMMVLAVVFVCVGQAQAVVITPDINMMPTAADEPFSFHLIVSDPMGAIGNTFQSTIGVSGPGILTFDPAESEAVADNVTGDPGYWVYGNNIGAGAIDRGGNNYEFADSPDFPAEEALIDGDIMARYAFTWGGTVGWYTFTLDLDTLKSYLVTLPDYETEALQFSPGSYPSDNPIDSFKVYIPEPTTLMLLALGSTVLLRKRS